MVVRIWTTGALVTCLFGAGVITLLLFTYIRYRSSLVLAYLIVVAGAMLLLISELSRIVPGIRLVHTTRVIGYSVLSVIGIGTVTFGIMNLAAVLIIPDQEHLFLPPILAVSTVTVLVMVYGQHVRFPAIIAISHILGTVSALYAAVFALLKRNRIANRRFRRFTCAIGTAVITAVPFELLRIFLWNRSVSPFGDSFPPFLLMIFFLVINFATLLIGWKKLIGISNKTASELDLEAVTTFELTPRECDIIMCIFSGCSNEEIGARLFISANTVKNHIYHIYQKTGVKNRVELLNCVIVNSDTG